MKIAFSAQYLKNVVFFVLTCLFLFPVLACKSTEVQTSIIPQTYLIDSRYKYEILGEVIYESKEGAGFVSLLKAARKLYPNCDYLIDIMIDQKTTKTTEETKYFPLNIIFFYLKNYQSVKTEVIWIMRGTAIKYVR